MRLLSKFEIHALVRYKEYLATFFFALLWSFALFPGNPTTDGLNSLKLAQIGVVDSHSTANYGLLFYFLTLKGTSIALLSICQVLIFFFSVWRLLNNTLGEQWARKLILYLSVSPLLFPIAWTNTHDVLSTAGFFLGLSLIVNNGKRETHDTFGLNWERSLIVLSAILISMHFNTIFVFSSLVITQFLVFLLKGKFCSFLKIVRIGVATTLLSLTLVFSILGTLSIGQGSSSNTGKVESFARQVLLADLACTSYLSDNSVIKLGNERKTPRDTLHACDLIFEEGYTSKYVSGFANQSTRNLIESWLGVMRKDPINLFISHYNRSWPIHVIALFPPYQEWDSDVTWLPNPPKSTQFPATFLSAYDIEDPAWEPRTGNSLIRLAQLPVGLWNKTLLITGNAGVLLLIALLVILSNRTSRRSFLNNFYFRIVVVVYLANLTSLTLVSTAPEVRYTYPSLIIVYVLLFMLFHNMAASFWFRFRNSSTISPVIDT